MVTVEQAIALFGALAAVITALGVLLGQLSSLRKDVNGRLTQLLEAEAARARKEGELAGRDYIQPRRRAVRRQNDRSIDKPPAEA